MTLNDLTCTIKAYRRAAPWLFFIRHTEFGLRLDSGDYYIYIALENEKEACFDVTYCNDRPIEAARAEVESGCRDPSWGGMRVCIALKRVKVMRFKQSGYMDWLRPGDLVLLRDVLEGMTKIVERLKLEETWRRAWRYAAPCVVDLRGASARLNPSANGNGGGEGRLFLWERMLGTEWGGVRNNLAEESSAFALN